MKLLMMSSNALKMIDGSDNAEDGVEDDVNGVGTLEVFV